MNSRLRIFPFLLLLCMPLAAELQGREESSEIFQDIRYIKRTQTVPFKQVTHIIEIDLSAPGLRFMTTPSNGEEGPRETWCETTSAFVRKTKAQIGINGNFYYNDKEEHTELLGLAVSNGEVVSPWDGGWAKYAVNISKNNEVAFVERAANGAGTTKTIPDIELYNTLSGNMMLVSTDTIQVPEEGDRHPRTGIGKRADNKLLLMVADGRQPGYSAGMTYYEMAQMFMSLGATEALALDGGGSATLVIAAPEPKVINAPMPMEMPGGLTLSPPGLERKNGNNLAVFAAPVQERADKPAAP